MAKKQGKRSLKEWLIDHWGTIWRALIIIGLIALFAFGIYATIRGNIEIWSNDELSFWTKLRLMMK